MLGGVAVCECYDITGGRWIKERTRTRDGRPEMYFLLTDHERVLPIYRAGRTLVVQWGASRGRGQALPTAAWLQLADLDSGRLSALDPEEVVVRASRAVDNGIWFDVREGVRAIVVRDVHGKQVVYPLVEPASHYYQVMTG